METKGAQEIIKITGIHNKDRLYIKDGCSQCGMSPGYCHGAAAMIFLFLCVRVCVSNHKKPCFEDSHTSCGFEKPSHGWIATHPHLYFALSPLLLSDQNLNK